MIATSFSGVSAGARGVVPGVGLYEFWADNGGRVALHELEFERLAFQVVPEGALTLSFSGGDDRAEDVVRAVDFKCKGVVIRNWIPATEDPSNDGNEASRVIALDWDGGLGFRFVTGTLSVDFIARSVDVVTST